MLLNLNRFAFPVFLKETRLLTALALPMLLAQVAQVGIGFVDTVMAGGAGKEDLAAVALGSSAFSTIYITFMGVMAALNPMIAQLYGAGKTEEVGKTGMQGIWFGLCLGVFGMLLMWAMITPFRHWLTLNDYVEDTMAQYMFFTSLAMPAAMIHRALHAYASSLNRPRVIMLVSFAAFVLNVPLNYVFVYGKFGMPALGGAGCGVATAAVFWFSALALWLYIAKEKFFRPFGLTAKIGKPDLTAFKQIWKIGAPIGLSYFLEASAFSFIVFFGGAIWRGLCRRATSRHQPVRHFVYGSAKRRLGKHGTRWLFARTARFFAGALYFRRVAGVGLDACCLHRTALGHLSLSVGRYVHQRCGRIRHCRDRFIFRLPIPTGRCHPMYRFICVARL